MNKIYVGIDISKEKCNLCYRRGLEIVREEECLNEIKALKKAIKAALKAQLWALSFCTILATNALYCQICTIPHHQNPENVKFG